MTRIIDDVKLDFQDVLLMPKRSELDSRSKVSLARTYKFKHAPVGYTGIPVVAANMDHTGTFEMAKVLAPLGLSTALHKFYSVKELVEFYKNADAPTLTKVFYSMGITDEDEKKFKEVWDTLEDTFRPDFVCVDVANGYSRKFVAFVEELRNKYPELVIMAGNVVTPDMTYDLLERGADIVKIGIGPGSVCTTRKITGVGYPQLSAIMECADAAHGANGLICGDGGVTSPGDVAKAFAGGADFVMCGGLFAGHKECSGTYIGDLLPDDQFEFKTERFVDPADFRDVVGQARILKRGREVAVTKMDIDTKEIYSRDPYPLSFFKPETVKMRFYGMSSKEAMDVHYGGKANYRASEGKAVVVPYKGPVVNTVEEILGGLRSACTYVGASSLKQLPKCATYVRVGRQLNTVFGE